MSADGQDVRTALEDIFRRVLRAPDLALTRDMITGAHLRWDSFANVEILLSCEERWGFEFGPSEIDSIRSFGDLHDAVVARIG